MPFSFHSSCPFYEPLFRKEPEDLADGANWLGSTIHNVTFNSRSRFDLGSKSRCAGSSEPIKFEFGLQIPLSYRTFKLHKTD